MVSGAGIRTKRPFDDGTLRIGHRTDTQPPRRVFCLFPNAGPASNFGMRSKRRSEAKQIQIVDPDGNPTELFEPAS
jgi:hypothetical protein